MGTDMSSVESLAVGINDAAETLNLTFTQINSTLAQYNIDVDVWVWPDDAGDTSDAYQLGISMCGKTMNCKSYELAVRYCEVENGDLDSYGVYELRIVPGSCSEPLPIWQGSRKQQIEMIERIATITDELKSKMGNRLRSMNDGREAANRFVAELTQ